MVLFYFLCERRNITTVEIIFHQLCDNTATNNPE